MLEWQLAETELIHEIVATAERTASARGLGGERILRTDALWSLLVALERSYYCCSVSDVARLLGIRRQAAHETARRAELVGAVDLLKNPDDRRIVQIVLTRAGRSRLATARSAERSWARVLLNGLEVRQMGATAHDLRVIRHRLLRDERERRR